VKLNLRILFKNSGLTPVSLDFVNGDVLQR
jgi:hypothetical protein